MQKSFTQQQSQEEEMFERVSILVDKMRTKYPKELNIDVFEPALTQDIFEIVIEEKNILLEEIKRMLIIRFDFLEKNDIDQSMKNWKNYKFIRNNIVDCLSEVKEIISINFRE